MDTTRVAAFSCGCLCAWVVQTAVAQELAPGAAAETFSAPDAAAQALPGEASAAPVPAPTGLRIQFDSGTMENVHRIVGFWPSMHWLNSHNAGTSMAALGYTWRNLRLEGALFKERDAGQFRSGSELLQIDSATRRLAYRFGPNWALQLSRGFLGSPDQLHKDQRGHRSTASLTYRGGFASNPWHATLAYGRGKGWSGSDGNAYLLDTAMRIDERHTVFGRIERAGHDELFQNEGGPRNQRYEAGKMSVGYLYESVTRGPVTLGVGGMVSRRVIPDQLLPYYGDNNTSYTVFLRFQMKFGGH